MLSGIDLAHLVTEKVFLSVHRAGAMGPYTAQPVLALEKQVFATPVLEQEMRVMIVEFAMGSGR
jgi:hypothetical protein